MRDDRRYEIRHRVQMPDGRNVEVLYAPMPAAATAAGAARQAARGAAQQAANGAARAAQQAASGAARQAAGGQTEAAAPALHVCVDCGCDRVHPLDWSERSPERWTVVLRCPDCEQTREGVFGRGMVERLDDELDRASASLLSDYRRLVHANMSEELERFAHALQLDLIGPADFADYR